jgi:hypothetical protein
VQIDPRKPNQLIFHKGAEAAQWSQTVSSVTVLEKLNNMCKKQNKPKSKPTQNGL